MADIFISYNDNDKDRVALIVRALEAKGWSTFWDWKSIPVTKNWLQFIHKGLKEAKCVLVLWSKESIKSEWVIEEALYGKRNKMLVPARIDDIQPPIGFTQIQAANLINWAGNIKDFEFKKLVLAIESTLNASSRQAREKPISAEDERRLKEVERQRKAEEELRRFTIIREEMRRLEEERQQATKERKDEEERKRKEIEARRIAEEERKRKEEEGEAEQIIKVQAERKAEAQKAAVTRPMPKESVKDENKQAEPKLSEPKSNITESTGKSPATKIGVLIILAVVVVAIAIWLFGPEPQVVFLYDDFSGNIVSSSNWHIPTWSSPTDGTFVGRTQFRCTQNFSLPAANGGNAIIAVESYNPTGFSFYGTDLISNQSFPLGKGIHITVRAKINTTTPGIIGGIYLYTIKPGSTTYRDEIDFELLTNRPDGAQTNIYGNEPLGAGHPQFVSYTSGSITDYHTYEIKWQPNKVSWLIDGILVRTDTTHVPTGPMNLHLNIWVPDWRLNEAYDSNLRPASSPSANKIFSMSIDSVTIQSITSPPWPLG